jgi:hypothetical protein
MADQYLRYNEFFSRLQYLLADSAFTTSIHVIEHGVHVLLDDQLLFNTLLVKQESRLSIASACSKIVFPAFNG